MRKKIVLGILVLCLFFFLVADVSLVLAQALPALTLLRPSSNSANPGYDVSGLGMFVQHMSVVNAGSDRICVRDGKAQTSYINLEVSAKGWHPRA